MVTDYITPAELRQALLRAKLLDARRPPVPRGTEPPPEMVALDSSAEEGGSSGEEL